MDLIELEKKLLAAGRATRPSDRVPLAFEKRIMARLKERPLDLWASWSGILWRASVPCLAVVIVLGALTLGLDLTNPTDAVSGPDLESAIYAVVDAPGDL